MAKPAQSISLAPLAVGGKKRMPLGQDNSF